MILRPPDDFKTTKYLFSFLLQLAAVFLYAVAFMSNYWFVLKPSQYGIWSVTFCDVLTCQTIPAIFNEQPGWYFFVQLFSVIGIVSAFGSLLMLFMKILMRNLPFRASIISSSCKISVVSIMTEMVVFYVSLLTESRTALPSISWATILATFSCILQISAFMLYR